MGERLAGGNAAIALPANSIATGCGLWVLITIVAPITSGYAYGFDPNALEKVAHFVANERKCCPLLNFEVALGAESGPLWLRTSGPPARDAAN